MDKITPTLPPDGKRPDSPEAQMPSLSPVSWETGSQFYKKSPLHWESHSNILKLFGKSKKGEKNNYAETS